MITKGIIEKIIDKNKAQVRIPMYDGVKSETNYVETDNLCVAAISSPAGMKLSYSVGDVVYVGFEEDQFYKPVILGLLQVESEVDSTSDIVTDSLKVNVNYTLPEATDDKVENELSSLELQISELKKSIVERPIGSLYFNTVNDPPAIGTWETAAESFILKFYDSENDTNHNVPIYLFRRVK